MTEEENKRRQQLEEASELSSLLRNTNYNKFVSYKQPGDYKHPGVVQVSAFSIKERKKIIEKINKLIGI